MQLIPAPSELNFRTSSYTNRNDCVEVADFEAGAAVRDSKHPDRFIAFDATEWSAFLAEVKRRGF